MYIYIYIYTYSCIYLLFIYTLCVCVYIYIYIHICRENGIFAVDEEELIENRCVTHCIIHVIHSTDLNQLKQVYMFYSK